MIGLLVTVVIGVILIALLWWVLSQIPLPGPLPQIVNIVLVVIAVIFLIYILVSFTGEPSLVRMR